MTTLKRYHANELSAYLTRELVIYPKGHGIIVTLQSKRTTWRFLKKPGDTTSL